jgi:hypothetical protein
MSIAVCMAFYSPCDYELPKRHLSQTLEWLAGEGVQAVLAQVVLPGQSPQPVPTGITSLVYESSDVMFYKENLWNLAARSCDADKLLFLDTDIVFGAADVIEQTSQLLDRVDVCQPFCTAVWLDRDRKIINARRSATFAISRGYEPHGRYYHPGFSWAMTRRAFDFIGGFYDRHILGGGDLGFAFALDLRWAGVDLRARNPHDAHFAASTSYGIYRMQAANLCLRVGCLENVDAIHQWHGDTADRQYCSRGSFLPLEPGHEYPVHARSDGLLEWDNPADSERVLAYFRSRREDG